MAALTSPAALGLPATPRRREPNGTAVALGFALVANALCVVGAAAFVTPLFVLGGVAAAVVLSRALPLRAIEFTLWLWVLGPQVRRMVDFATGYHDPSLILLAAPLASLVNVHLLRHLRDRPHARLVRPLIMTAAAIGSGFAIGAVRLGLQPAAVAFLQWAVPVLFGLQVLAVSEDTADLRDTIERFLTWSAIIVGGYGLLQFYLVPAWDAFWMNNVPMNSIGTPRPFEIRVFSTLNAPGPMAAFLTAALLYLIDSRARYRVPALVLGHVALALSLVRASWIAWGVGIVIVLLAGRSLARSTALVLLGAIAIASLQMTGPVHRVVADRIDETREGTQDDSFVARAALYRAMVPGLLTNAVGNGLGTTGAASEFLDQPSDLFALDSGLIDYGYSLGLPAATLALGALLLGGTYLSRMGLRTGRVSAGTVAGGASLLVHLAFDNLLLGVGGILFFLLWAHATHALAPSSRPPRTPPRRRWTHA